MFNVGTYGVVGVGGLDKCEALQVPTGTNCPIAAENTSTLLTRRDASLAGSPLRVVGWARRAVENAQGTGSWARWQSSPARTRGELQEAWAQAQRWAHART